MKLRWFIRYIPAPELGPNVVKKEKVLQQWVQVTKFENEGYWEDIPEVEE